MALASANISAYKWNSITHSRARTFLRRNGKELGSRANETEYSSRARNASKNTKRQRKSERNRTRLGTPQREARARRKITHCGDNEHNNRIRHSGAGMRSKTITRCVGKAVLSEKYCFWSLFSSLYVSQSRLPSSVRFR